LEASNKKDFSWKISTSFGAKTASTRASIFEKIVGCHEFLDRQMDR